MFQPSRELAEQTIVQLQKFKKHLSNPAIRELLIIGGVAAREQVESLERGVSRFESSVDFTCLTLLTFISLSSVCYGAFQTNIINNVHIE